MDGIRWPPLSFWNAAGSGKSRYHSALNASLRNRLPHPMFSHQQPSNGNIWISSISTWKMLCITASATNSFFNWKKNPQEFDDPSVMRWLLLCRRHLILLSSVECRWGAFEKREILKNNSQNRATVRYKVRENNILTRNLRSYAKYLLQRAVGTFLCILQGKVKGPFLWEILCKIFFNVWYFFLKMHFSLEKLQKTDLW